MSIEESSNKKLSTPVKMFLLIILLETIVVCYFFINSSWTSIAARQSELVDMVNNSYEYSEYDNKYVTGTRCLSAVSLFRDLGTVTILFRAKDIDAESEYSGASDLYCIPKASIERRIFESQIEKYKDGKLKSIIFTLKEPMRDRVTYSANLNQVGVRDKFDGLLVTELGEEAVYNDATHVYITDNPERYATNKAPTVDTSKLYDIYELLSASTYGRVGYYLKESEVQH